jgi:lipid-A-disaccharide synthase
MDSAPLRIGIVAGEASGDVLGASLLESLNRLYPEVESFGVGGPLMQEQGFTSWYPMERLSVMGLVEPLKRLPELLAMRRDLGRRFAREKPDVFVGIDSPDFNITLERQLRKSDIKVAHYVSPSVWAWRQGRIKSIKRSVDLMMTLFPFEQEIYQQQRIPVTCVGHPLADEFPDQTDREACCQGLGIDPETTWIALLPGSRAAEVEQLGHVFLQAAGLCQQEMPDAGFLIPAASSDRKQQLQELLARYPGVPARLFDGRSREVMGASHLVVMASGTTTLEAMLLKRPMVVAYRMSNLSYQIISRMLKVPWVSLPNLLADEELVPELLQGDATPENISSSVCGLLHDKYRVSRLQEHFSRLHESLRCGAGDRAAAAIRGLVSGDSV